MASTARKTIYNKKHTPNWAGQVSAFFERVRPAIDVGDEGGAVRDRRGPLRSAGGEGGAAGRLARAHWAGDPADGGSADGPWCVSSGTYR